MTRIKQGLITSLNGVTANGPGVALDVSNYKAIALQLRTKNNAAATIKFAVSMSLNKPDFSIPPSYVNPYDFVDLAWLNNNNSVPGATGIVLTGTDLIRIYEVNTDYIKWLCPIVSGYAAGDITVETDAVNDFTRS